MKKIYSLLLLAVCTLAFTACSDNDEVGSEYSRMSTVKVTSSNLVFSAAAGTGTLVFEAPSAATVSVDAQWATAVVSGNKVDVSVMKNARLEGRSALLTIKSGEDSTQVTIQQRGMQFKYGGESQLFVYNDEPRTISIPVSNEGSDLSIKGLDWAKASINDEGIKIQLTENNTGHIRSGFILYKAGPYTDSLQVVQGEKKDILNRNYYLGGYDLAKMSQNTQSLDELLNVEAATIVENEGKLVIYFPNKNWILPMTFDESSLTFNVKAGENMGMYYNYFHAFSGVVDYKYLSTFLKNEIGFAFALPESQLSISGYFDYSEKNRATIAPFVDNQDNDAMIQGLTDDPSATFDANTLGVFAFKTEVVSKDSYKAPILLYYQPFLMEVPAKGAKAAVLGFGSSFGKAKISKQAILEKVKRTLAASSFQGGILLNQAGR